MLARVDPVLDLSWLADEVVELYADGFGRPGIDPEVAVRLMLAGFLLGIIHDRRLMRDASVHLAIRWFAGFGMPPATFRGATGSFRLDPDQATLGLGAVSGDLCAGGARLPEHGDRLGRCRAYGRHFDPGRCQPWFACRAAYRCR